MTVLQPVESASGRRGSRRLTSVVYDGVRARLFTGQLAAGERLSVEALRSDFGVSKQPVMEALRLLSADGLVEIIPQVGCRVSSYKPRDVVDFYTTLARVEAITAAAAAERRKDEDLPVLEELSRSVLLASEYAEDGAGLPSFSVRNRRFHEFIHQMADSSVLLDLSRRMRDLGDFFVGTHAVLPYAVGTIPDRVCEHEAIVDAIKRQDAPAAYAAAELHVSATVELFQFEEEAITGAVQ